MDLNISYLWLFLGWIIYFSIHSFFASTGAKIWFKNHMKFAHRFYRMLYTFFAVAGLFFLLMINSSMDSLFLLPKNPVLTYISLMVTTFGIIVLSTTFKSYSIAEFIGIRSNSQETLITGGILAYIRHPIYSATILLVLGYWLFEPTLASTVTAVTIFLYLPLGIWLEEKKLIKEFGEKYLSYKEKVPSLIPKFRKAANS